jgi:hypothetical protein
LITLHILKTIRNFDPKILQSVLLESQLDTPDPGIPTLITEAHEAHETNEAHETQEEQFCKVWYDEMLEDCEAKEYLALEQLIKKRGQLSIGK